VIWPPPEQSLEGSLVRLEPLAEAHREPLRSVAGFPEIWQWMDRRVAETEGGFDQWFDGRMTLQTVACRRPRSLACRARHAPCVLGRLGFRAPGKNLGSRHSQIPRVRLADAGPSGGRTQGDRIAALFGRPRTTPREVCPAPPGVRASKHMLMPVTGVRDSAYFSIVDDEWPAVRQNLEQRLAGAREVESA
jgi:N-acetyltransferase